MLEEPGQAGVQITDEMTRAGRDALYRFLNYAPELQDMLGPYTAADLVNATFLAMNAARSSSCRLELAVQSH